MIRRILIALLLLGGASAASAQSVQQSGSVTTGHLSSWATSGVLQDAGTATAGKVNSLGLYGNGGTPFCITRSATAGPFTGGYSQLCSGISSTGAYLNIGNYGGDATTPFQVIQNGTVIFQTSASGISLPLTSGYLFVGNASNLSASVPLTGDCSITNVGVITCASTNGTAFGALATLGYDTNFTSAAAKLALVNVPSGGVLGNSTAGSAEPTGVTLSALMDRAFGANQGSVATRGATAWTAIAPGAPGTYLQSQGSSANLGWGTPSVALGTVYTSTSGNPTITPAMFILVVNNTAPAATTVNLPAAPTASFLCVVKDGGGVAQIYPITVNGNGNTIDGASTVMIRQNYGSLNFAWNGTSWNQW